MGQLTSGYAGPIARITSGSIVGVTPLLVGYANRTAALEQFGSTRLFTNPTGYSRPVNAYFEEALNPVSATLTDFHNIDALVYGGGSNVNFTANSSLYCIEGKSLVTSTAGQTIQRAVGVFGTAISNGSNGTLQVAEGVQAQIQNTGTGTITDGIAFYVKAPVNSGGGVITNAYGLFMQNINAGSVGNYAIQTNQGRIHFFASTAVPAGGTVGVGVTMSSTNNLGLFFGSGAPTLSAAKGSLYIRTDGTGTNDRAYVNTDGGTTWTNFVTAL